MTSFAGVPAITGAVFGFRGVGCGVHRDLERSDRAARLAVAHRNQNVIGLRTGVARSRNASECASGGVERSPVRLVLDGQGERVAVVIAELWNEGIGLAHLRGQHQIAGDVRLGIGRRTLAWSRRRRRCGGRTGDRSPTMHRVSSRPPPPHAARVRLTSADKTNWPSANLARPVLNQQATTLFPSTHMLGRRKNLRSMFPRYDGKVSPYSYSTSPATPLSEAHRAKLLSSRPEALRPRFAAGLPNRRA